MLGCFLSVTLASVSCIVKGYCRTQVCPDQRMRRFKARRQLRQEQGGEEKPMARQLDHTRFAFPINAGALQRSAQYPGTIYWVEAEVAAKLFRCLCNTIRVMHLRPSCEPYRLRLPHKRADQTIDEQGVSCGAVSSWSASSNFSTWRAYSTRVCWKPPQVPKRACPARGRTESLSELLPC